MGKGIKYGLCVLAGAVVLAVATAAVPPPDGFRMGRNMEVLVNMLRDISLFYVDDVDPDELLSDAAAGMTAGLDPSVRYLRIADRAEAIRTAVMLSRPGDILLVAGKGHETYQIVGDEKRHFDDREEVRRAFAALSKPEKRN
mgnify:CR=1 FL=1